MTRTIPLTPYQTLLLGILQANGGWMSRRAIAAVLGYEYLQNHHVHALNKMLAMGIVELRRARNLKGNPRYEYRAIMPPANGV